MSLKPVGIAALVLALAGLLALLGWGMLNQTSVTGRSGFTRIGKPAPDFRIPRFDGGEFVLSEHAGDPIVINFWASWCPPCRVEALLLERIWQRDRQRGLLLVGVNIQDPDENARTFLKEFGITYPNASDANGAVTVDYGVIGLPVTFFVNRAGIVARRWVGAIDEDTITLWVDQLIEGVAPSGATEAENLQEFFKLDQSGE